jgi:hypothetical protein
VLKIEERLKDPVSQHRVYARSSYFRNIIFRDGKSLASPLPRYNLPS